MRDNLNVDEQIKKNDKATVQVGNNKLLGIVVAGGLSSRMGEQKPKLKVYGQTEPDMLQRTASLLEKCVGDLWVSCRENQLDTEYHCVYDKIEGLGPIGGLHASLSAVHKSKWQAILVLSCDLPFMNENIIQGLIKAREKALMQNPDLLMTTYKQAETGYIESLVAIYETSALCLFDEALKDGARRINLIIPAKLRHDILYSAKENLPFFNINYPEDLKKARKLLKS